jgi:hypothetical protein
MKKRTIKKKRPAPKDPRNLRALVEDMAYGRGLEDAVALMRELLSGIMSPGHVTITCTTSAELDGASVNMKALEKARAFMDTALDQLSETIADDVANGESAVAELVRRHAPVGGPQ